jgi:hypothetical protein
VIQAHSFSRFSSDRCERAAFVYGSFLPPIALRGATEFVINLRTRKALGLAVPDRLLALADDVIE